MRSRWLALVLLAEIGCVSSHWHPRSAVPAAPVAVRAVRIYEADVPTLKAAGAELLGSVESNGSGVSSHDDLAADAADVAAERGGTHFILASSGVQVSQWTTPGRANTTCTPDISGSTSCSTSYTPPTSTPIYHPFAGFQVVRVPPERWKELPEALRPSPR
jgi:hypothetical protein